jgi:uncharacterized damage-inducible protein DinB
MKRIISLNALSFLFLGSVLSNNASAQALSNDDIKMQMVSDWQRAKAYTIEYLHTMPADKYSFKAVDSLRSFAMQMLHLATGNVFLMSNATDQPPLPWTGFELENRKTAQSADSVMYFVTASYDYCINAVKNCDPGKWKEKKTVFGFEATKYEFMLKAFEHQTHHRGQTTIYIRLNNIKPPQEKLF